MKSFFGCLLGSLLLLTSNIAIAQTNYTALRRKSLAAKPCHATDAGFVPNATVAKQIAEAVWVPIYGKEHIEEKKPFRAVLVNNEIWVVEGSLPKRYDVGGTAYIEINKRDGRILEVTHGK
ncbi:YbbC/YhhH family protein [Hymenobacter terricola]|uniref:YbbC/YhhH family protein n=1 Tax=Hymenobacter terricola TaxID=2819236 RepID=UPI001B30B0AD|nr:YbbC/YhhH family protein [Hymenobacter terricola]